MGWPEGTSECTMLSPLPPSLKAKQENELPGSVLLFPCRDSQSKLAELQQSTPLHSGGAELAAWAQGTYIGV